MNFQKYPFPLCSMLRYFEINCMLVYRTFQLMCIWHSRCSGREGNRARNSSIASSCYAGTDFWAEGSCGLGSNARQPLNGRRSHWRKVGLCVWCYAKIFGRNLVQGRRGQGWRVNSKFLEQWRWSPDGITEEFAWCRERKGRKAMSRPFQYLTNFWRNFGGWLPYHHHGHRIPPCYPRGWRCCLCETVGKRRHERTLSFRLRRQQLWFFSFVSRRGLLLWPHVEEMW